MDLAINAKEQLLNGVRENPSNASYIHNRSYDKTLPQTYLNRSTINYNIAITTTEPKRNRNNAEYSGDIEHITVTKHNKISVYQDINVIKGKCEFLHILFISTDHVVFYRNQNGGIQKFIFTH